MLCSLSGVVQAKLYVFACEPEWAALAKELGGDQLELPLALSTVRESDSIVKAKNGQVVVIGGLMKNVSSDNVGSVPGVSDAPVVGELFKQKRKLVRRSELVILLRPIVIEKGEIWSQMINESADRVRTLRPVSLEQGE